MGSVPPLLAFLLMTFSGWVHRRQLMLRDLHARHGQTVGFYIPVPKRPGQDEREALLEAGRRMQAELARLGVTEEELVADFKRWHKARRAK